MPKIFGRARFIRCVCAFILEFERQYKNATTIRLEQNYRSTQNILSAANELIRNNAHRKGKELWTDNGSGAKIRFHRSDTQEGEAEYVTRMITEGVADGKQFSDYAILCASRWAAIFCWKSRLTKWKLSG